MATYKHTQPTAKPTRKGGKAPRDPSRSRVVSLPEEAYYASSQQIDPWRGQIVALSWEYCV